MAPGSEVASSADGGIVAWIDVRLPRELTVYEVARGQVLARVPVDEQAAVVAVDDLTVYVNDSDGHFASFVGGASRRTNGVTVLDAAGGVLAVAAGPGEIELVRDGEVVQRTTGDTVDLSPSGRFAVIREEGALPAVRAVDVATGAVLGIEPAEDGEAVTDAAFDGDAQVSYVVRGPNAAPSRGRDDPDLTPRRSDFVTCSLESGPCVRTLRIGAASAGPILAH